jgi:hypothetical protein
MNCLRALEWVRIPSRQECLCVLLLCLCRPTCRYAPSDGLIPAQGALLTVYRIKKLEKAAKVQQWAIEPLHCEAVCYTVMAMFSVRAWNTVHMENLRSSQAGSYEL